MAPPLPNWSHVHWPDIKYTPSWIRRLQMMYRNYWVTEITQNVFVVEDLVLKPYPRATITPPPTPCWTTMPTQVSWDTVPIIHPGRSSMWGAFGVDLWFYLILLCYFFFLLAIGGFAWYFLRGCGGGGGGDGPGSGPGFGSNGGKRRFGGPGGKKGKRKEPLFPFYGSYLTITKKALIAKVNGTSSSNHGNEVDGNSPPPMPGYGSALFYRPWSVFVNNTRLLVGTRVSHEFPVDDNCILNVVISIPVPPSTPQKSAPSNHEDLSLGYDDAAPSTGNDPSSGEDDASDSWIDDNASIGDFDNQHGDLPNSSGHHCSPSSTDNLARLRRLDDRFRRGNNSPATSLLRNIIWLFVYTVVSFLILGALLNIFGSEHPNGQCWTRSSYFLFAARRDRRPYMAIGFFLCFALFGLIVLFGREEITDWFWMIHSYAGEISWSLFEALPLVPSSIWNGLLVLYAWLLLLWEFYRHPDSPYKTLTISIVLSVGAIVLFLLDQRNSPKLKNTLGRIHSGWEGLSFSKTKDLAFDWTRVITFIRQSCWPVIQSLTGAAFSLVGHLLGLFCKGVWVVAKFIFEQQQAYNRGNDQYIAQLQRELADTKDQLIVKTQHEEDRYREVIKANNNWESDLEKLKQAKKEIAGLKRKNAVLSQQAQEAESDQPQIKASTQDASLEKENTVLRSTVERLKSRNAILSSNNKVLDKSRAENERLKARLMAVESQLKAAESKPKPQQTPSTKAPMTGKDGDEQAGNGTAQQNNNTSGASSGSQGSGQQRQPFGDKKQQLGTNGPKLEEADKESSVGTAKKEEPVDASQSHSQSGNQEPSEDQQPSGGAKPSQDDKPSAEKAQPKPSVSHSDRFNSSFPGGYSIVPTRADGLLCGYYAIIESLKAMDFKPLPEIDEFEKSFEDPEVRKALNFGLETGEILNSNWFGPDQLAVILRHCGEQRGRQLQLGYITDDDLLQVEFHERSADPETVIVWIHNSKGAHWSGLRQGNIKPKAAKKTI
ncbi:MAG: hypothetical protein Q9181_003913 [Wetmoreana brouardii]